MSFRESPNNSSPQEIIDPASNFAEASLFLKEGSYMYKKLDVM